jgi:hypothetical protein
MFFAMDLYEIFEPGDGPLQSRGQRRAEVCRSYAEDVQRIHENDAF